MEATQEVKRAAARRFYTDTLLTRLDNPSKGSIIAIMQRLHEDDFPAFLIEGGRYRHLNLPAIAEAAMKIALHRQDIWHRRQGDILDPHRFTLAKLDELKAEIGRVTFAAQYQQAPVLPEGGLIDMTKLKLVDHPPGRDECQLIIQSWDTAVETGPNCCYSVCTTWGYKEDDNTWHLLDLFRARLRGADLQARIIQLRDKWKPLEVVVERTNATSIMCSNMETDGKFVPTLLSPKGAKLERVTPHLDWFESGKLAFPTEVDWWPDLKNEMRAFPDGRYDDQVDSISQFLRYVRHYGEGYLLDIDPETGRMIGNYRPDFDRRW